MTSDNEIKEEVTLPTPNLPKDSINLEMKPAKKSHLPLILTVGAVLILVFGLAVGAILMLANMNTNSGSDKSGVKNNSNTSGQTNPGDTMTGSVTPTATIVPTIAPTTTTQAAATGNFGIDLGYPSDGDFFIKLCFENTTDLTKTYCYLKENVEGKPSTGKTAGSLPVGKYFAYALLVFDKSGSGSASYWDFNECTYNKKCDEYKKENKAWDDLLRSKGINGDKVNSGFYNEYYGGKRVVFEIKTNQTLEMGETTLNLVY